MSPILLTVLICLWLYLLHVLTGAQMHLWRSLVGSAGLCILGLYLLLGPCTGPMAQLVSALAGMLGKMTGACTAYTKYALLFVPMPAGAFTLKVDLECTGLLEILLFLSVLLFWRAYRPYERLVIGAVGALYITLCNALRLALICLALHLFGQDVYSLMHAVVGRVLFYGLSILLYYAVFMRPRLIWTRVSNRIYGRN